MLAAVAATLLGTTVVAHAPTVLQIAGAFAVATLTLAVVPLAAQGITSLPALVAGMLSAGAASIHYAVIAEHLEEWWLSRQSRYERLHSSTKREAGVRRFAIAGVLAPDRDSGVRERGQQ